MHNLNIPRIKRYKKLTLEHTNVCRLMLDWANCQWIRPHALIQRKHFASIVFAFGKGNNLTLCIISGYLDSLLHFPQEQFFNNLSKIYINIYICKCFSLHDINNVIDVQFCMNTFDHVISFFSIRMNTSGSLYYFHIVYQRKQYRLKKELIFISTSYIVVAYIVTS